jgi:hypothetical protein
MSQTLPERRSTTEPQRWEPLSELEQMTQRMRRMLDQTFGGFGLQSPLITEGAGWAPLVDIEEQDDAYVLEAELPGVKREDVNIEVAGNEPRSGARSRRRSARAPSGGGHAAPGASSTASDSRSRSTPRRSRRASSRAS